MSRKFFGILSLFVVAAFVIAMPLFFGQSPVFSEDLEQHTEQYKGPVQIVPSPDGTQLYVLNADAAEIAVVSVAGQKVTQTIPVPPHPNGMALCPKKTAMIVTCGDDYGKVVLINLANGEILNEAKTGHSPYAPVLTPDGQKLFLCNRFNATVAEYSFPEFKLTKTIPVVREPIAAAITPDGKILFVNNFLPNQPSDAFHVACEVTAIDVASGTTKNITLPNGVTGLHGLCLSPDGKYAYAVGVLARHTIPTTQIERGWINTAGLNIIDIEKQTLLNTVLLDDVDLGAANPWAVTTSDDGGKIYVAIAGAHELCIIDAPQMLAKLLKLPQTIEEAKAAGTYNDRGTYSSSTAADVPNDLAFLVGMKKRVRLPGRAPRSVVALGTTVWLGAYFSDALEVVDTTTAGGPRVSEIALGPKPEMSPARKGMLAWHDATNCMQQWQSCSSCHPDVRMDALNWDLLNDGMGNRKNAKSMLHSQELPPAMWRGVRKDAYFAIRTGFKYIQMTQPNEEVCKNIEAMFQSLRPLNSPLLVNGELSESAKRGKELFESERIGCFNCHPAPLFADKKMHDVDSVGEYDNDLDRFGNKFDTPSLVESWRTAPYLHDGRYVDMHDLFIKGKHGHRMGKVDEMTDQEVNDLVEYVLSL
ncbi:MAG: c-type cytochrome [Planctomycetaceae bacterium]|nr:c-type cytochrome [Planctomycetaceae bacterium]